MRPEAQPSDIQEATWRAEFERLGRETVRVAICRGQGLSPDRKREVAILWLREREAATEERERAAHWYLKWTFAVAVLAATVSFIILAVILIARLLPPPASVGFTSACDHSGAETSEGSPVRSKSVGSSSLACSRARRWAEE